MDHYPYSLEAIMNKRRTELKNKSVEMSIEDEKRAVSLVMNLMWDVSQGMIGLGNVLHGDLKPSNLLLRSDWHFDIIDFGDMQSSVESVHSTLPQGTSFYKSGVLLSQNPTITHLASVDIPALAMTALEYLSVLNPYLYQIFTEILEPLRCMPIIEVYSQKEKKLTRFIQVIDERIGEVRLKMNGPRHCWDLSLIGFDMVKIETV